MNPISITFGQTVTVRRGGRDRTGDQALVDHHTIDQAVFWQESVSGDDNFRDTSTVYGQLSVPRDADLLATDHVRLADGSNWVAVGAPAWNHVHPMTGWDPGYKVARMKGVS